MENNAQFMEGTDNRGFLSLKDGRHYFALLFDSEEEAEAHRRQPQ